MRAFRDLSKVYPSIFEFGRITEQIFFISAKKSGLFSDVYHSDEKTDLFHRIDFIATTTDGQKLFIDVKARRRRKRCGRDWAIVIEIFNKNGKRVSEKRFTHYAFENPFEKSFWIIPKKDIHNFVRKELIRRGAEILRYPEYFHLYQREKDVCYILPEEYFFEKITHMVKAQIDLSDGSVRKLWNRREEIINETIKRCGKIQGYARRYS